MYGVTPYPKFVTFGDAFKTHIKSLLVYKKKEIQNRVSRKEKARVISFSIGQIGRILAFSEKMQGRKGTVSCRANYSCFRAVLYIRQRLRDR